jgi:hypothetical protein
MCDYTIEDGFRDHTQRLGMEACRAWTQEPSLRTFQVQLVALSLLRVLQAQLDHVWGEGRWWLKPEWNRSKRHASLLDLRRLFWRYRAEFSQFLVALEGVEKIPQPQGLGRNPTEDAA